MSVRDYLCEWVDQWLLEIVGILVVRISIRISFVSGHSAFPVVLWEKKHLHDWHAQSYLYNNIRYLFVVPGDAFGMTEGFGDDILFWNMIFKTSNFRVVNPQRIEWTRRAAQCAHCSMYCAYTVSTDRQCIDSRTCARPGRCSPVHGIVDKRGSPAKVVRKDNF